ncbi:MAG TPA: DUF4214 domain-containing protein [Clostridiales bacterium]|nr:DUF4214 domain-containing protein [Clostridiales bacterium]
MDKFERLHFDGPKKEFVYNNLAHMLEQSQHGESKLAEQVMHVHETKYDHNRYLRLFFRVALRNDPVKIEHFTKRMVNILDRFPRLKKWLKARLTGKTPENCKKVSLHHLLDLDVNNFIIKLYIEMLGREPDIEGFNCWQKAVCSSMPKEAVIFAVSKTKEFNNRFQIKDIEKYKRIYLKYKLKNSIKKMPIIGYLIKLVIAPVRIEQLVIAQNIRNENLIHHINQLFGSTLHRINEIQAFNYQFLCDYIESQNKTDKENYAELAERIDKCRNDSLEYISKNVKELENYVTNRFRSFEKKFDEIQGNYEKLDDNVNISLSAVIRRTDEMNNVIGAYSEVLCAQSDALKTHQDEAGIQLDRLNDTLNDLIEKVESIDKEIDLLARNTAKQMRSVFDRCDEYERQRTCLPVFDSRYEMQILKKSNISLLEGLVASESADGSGKVVVVGHYAKEVFDDAGRILDIRYYGLTDFQFALSERKTYEFSMAAGEQAQQVMEKSDKIIILNPALASMMIMEDKIHELALKVKDELIMCFDTNDGNDISVVWGSGFSGIERSADGEYHRWYQGADPEGTISIVNNTVYRQECVAEFILGSLDDKSQITVIADNEEYTYTMENGFSKVTLELTLLPGVNNIMIRYYGKAVQPDGDLRILKFAVKGLRISGREGNVQPFCVSGSSAYVNQDKLGFLFQNPGDELIRSNLHSNGFYEVEAFICSQKSDKLISNGLSRYCEPSKAYEFITEHQPHLFNGGIAVYIAKRKGKYRYGI